jgi:hypothetical protein
MALVLVLVWFGLLVHVCWSVLLSSVGNNSCPLWATTLVLCGQQLLSSVSNNSCPLWATTLVLCGQQPLSSVGNNPYPLWATTLILCGQQPLSSVGNNSFPLWNNNPCPLLDSRDPLWDIPPSVVIFPFNWLVWSVVKVKFY